MNESLESTACEAAVAINLAVADLLLPRHIFRLFTHHQETGGVSAGYATAARRLAMQVLVVNLFRLWEVREHLLCPWLFSDEQLRAMGFLPLEEFIDRWPALLTIRHQFAGHILNRESQQGKPGRILSPEAFGRALREAGLWDADVLLERVEHKLIPAVELVRAELFRRWPASEDYVRQVYPHTVSHGAGDKAARHE
jgi:hypothetical protein